MPIFTYMGPQISQMKLASPLVYSLHKMNEQKKKMCMNKQAEDSSGTLLIYW